MADDNETVGTNLEAQGAQQFLRDIEAANKALQDLGKSAAALDRGGDMSGVARGIKNADDAAKSANSTLSNTLKALENLPVIGPQISQLAGAMHDVEGAGSAAGAAISSGMAVAVTAIGAVIAIAVAAAAAIAGINSSVQGLADYGAQINDISKVTGASADMAQQINASARIAGVGVDTIGLSFLTLNDGAIKAGEEGSKALAKIGGAADTTARQLQRLNEDHIAKLADAEATLADKVASARSTLADHVADINATLASRLADINAQMADNEENYQKSRARASEAYNKQIEDGRAQLAQRLNDLEESHTQRVSDLQQSLADELASFDQQRKDRETQLQDSLAGVESTYQDKRNAVNAKYFAPKSEREKVARDEELKLLDEQQAAEEKKLKDQAAKEEARLQAAHDKKLKAIQQQIDRENEQYAKQTERLKQEDAKREADLTASFNQQNQDAKEAYDKQVAAAQKAQAQIRAETDKRLQDEQKSYEKSQAEAQKTHDRTLKDEAKTYERSLEDIQTKTAGAAAGLTRAVSPVEKAFDKLGISLAEWNSLSPDQQILRLGKALDGIKDPVQKLNILSDIFGRRRAIEMLEFFEVFSKPHPLGLQLTQKELDDLQQFQRDQREMDLQWQLLGYQIGQVFFPIWRDLLGWLKQFWAEHGPAVTKAVKDIATWLKEHLGEAVRGTVDLWNNHLKPAFTAVWNFLNQNVFPILRDLNTFFVGAFKVGLGIVILAFGGVLEALKPVWKALDDVFQKVTRDLQPALTWFKDNVLSPLGRIFDDVGRAVSRFFQGLTQEFQRIQQSFPDWLKKLLGIESPSFNVSYSNPTDNPFYDQYRNLPGSSSALGAMGHVNATSRALPMSASQIYNTYGPSNTSSTSSSMVQIDNITVSVGSGGYQSGYQAGLGIKAALRAKGVPLSGYGT